MNRITALPASIGRLTSLRVLDVSKNRLTSLPSELVGCFWLRSIEAQVNRLSSLPALHLSHLTALDLSNNRFEELQENAFCGLQSLSRLELNHNQLTSLPQSLTDLSHIYLLSVHHNQLTELMPFNFDNLQYLRQVNFSHNRISKMRAWNASSALVDKLDLSHNELCVLPKELAGFGTKMRPRFGGGRSVLLEGNPLLTDLPFTNDDLRVTIIELTISTQRNFARHLIADIALGLFSLDLPVLVILSIAEHLLDAEHAPNERISWAIAVKVKQFER